MKLFLSFILVTVANADVLQLTPDNYSELTTGKTVFLKFFAPWCVSVMLMV
jgi:thiol-disulfide isomerase/thioredoxin